MYIYANYNVSLNNVVQSLQSSYFLVFYHFGFETTTLTFSRIIDFDDTTNLFLKHVYSCAVVDACLIWTDLIILISRPVRWDKLYQSTHIKGKLHKLPINVYLLDSKKIVIHGLDSKSAPTKYHNISICCFSNDIVLLRIVGNISQCSHMSILELLFEVLWKCCSTCSTSTNRAFVVFIMVI